MSPAPLTVHNAEITTAAVEVKTLTIKGKQVTLAVFRQIREEDILTPQLTYLGNPWGSVNYHVGCDNVPTEHRHVVWQKGSELRRSVIKAPDPSLGRPEMHLIDAWVEQIVPYLGAPGPTPDTGYEDLRESRAGIFQVRRSDGSFAWATTAASRAATRDAQAVRQGRKQQPPLEAVQKAWADLMQDWTEAERFYARYSAAWHEVTSLPQLFIAV